MKYHDPKTGEAFEDIEKALQNYCDRHSCSCGCSINSVVPGSTADLCIAWCNAHPAVAARLMGLEIIADKEETMEQKDTPRICEVLGVEVNEEWRVTGNDMATYRINEDGEFEYAMPLYRRPGHGGWRDSDMAHLLDFIEHPDRIIRKPRFTAEEVADAKALMRILGASGIERSAYGRNLCAVIGEVAKVVIDQGLFPSLRPGQALRLEDVLEGGESHG